MGRAESETVVRRRVPRHVIVARLGLALALAPALAMLLGELREPLHGEHVFRQAHVAANVEKYVLDGLSLRPATYNVDVPGALFDFPAYQLVVAALCRTFGWPALPAARAVNVAILAATLVVAARVLARLGAGATERAFALCFFAWSPLNLFYGATPLSDPLAVLLALTSVLACLEWDAHGGQRAYLGLLVAGVLATLIKNPVYLPFLIGLGYDRMRRRGARALVTPRFAFFAASIVAAVVFFKLYSNHVNATDGFLAPEEAGAYFGTWADRLRRKFWRALWTSLGTRVLPEAAALAALCGLALLLGRGRCRRRSLATGLACGVVLTLGLFFGRHREHDYYQLPFVFPAALWAALAAQRVLVFGLAARRARRPAQALVAACALVGLVAQSAGAAHATWRAMSVTPGASELRARGEWLQARTQPDDVVAVVVGTDERNWDPSHLYFAQRDGSNLAQSELTQAALDGLRARFPGRPRLLLFLPWPQRQALAPRVRALDLHALVSDEVGDLYEVR